MTFLMMYLERRGKNERYSPPHADHTLEVSYGMRIAVVA